VLVAVVLMVEAVVVIRSGCVRCKWLMAVVLIM
jgi:hypothetical protein